MRTATSLVVSTLVFLSACSAPPRESSTSSSADIAAAPSSSSRVSQLGNPMQVVVTSAELAPPTVQVTYDDEVGYFGGASTIQAYIDAAGHAKATGAPEQGAATITLTGNGSTYTGSYVVAWIDRTTAEMVLDSISLAFSNAQGKLWDSNESNNYVFPESLDFPVVNFGSNEVTTVFNNHTSLAVYGIPPQGSPRAPNVTITYFDDVGAFGNAPTLSAYLASSLVLAGQTVSLASAGQRRYTASVPIQWAAGATSSQVIESFQLAFADSGQTNWDSNHSNNYRFQLGANASVCDVTAYGARGDGVTDDTAAIQAAVDDCATRGVSAVSIPASSGVFVSGMIALKSNITLSIGAGTTLKGSMDDHDYPTVIPDAANSQVAINCQKALVYAESASNVTITGGGTIDGSGENPSWINLSTTSADYLERNRPIAVYTALSSNVTLENVTVLNAAMWAVVNLEDDGLHVDNVTVTSNYPGSRTRDGIDTVDSQNVLI